MASDGPCKHHILRAAEAIEERTDLDWRCRSTTHTEDLRHFYEQSGHQLWKGKWALLTLSLSLGCLRHVNHPTSTVQYLAVLLTPSRTQFTHAMMNWSTSYPVWLIVHCFCTLSFLLDNQNVVLKCNLEYYKYRKYFNFAGKKKIISYATVHNRDYVYAWSNFRTCPT
jgi:hypothetical protein